MPSDFDFDTSDSDLNIGIELEYPGARPNEDEILIDRGRSTVQLQRELPGRLDGIRGNLTYDGTVGLEIVSPVLSLDDAAMWVAESIEVIEDRKDVLYQPVGLMETGSTAGMHLHLSDLSAEKARQLYEISQETWAKVFFCSSIARSDNTMVWPVFRGGNHCRWEYDADRYSCVNNRAPGHYEWRLPEPVTPDHVEIIAKFLRIFESSVDQAVQYAQEILDDGDDRITSIKRAEAVGMEFENMPVIDRQPSPHDPENFFDTIEDTWAAPEIYRVNDAAGDFYVFNSDMEGVIEINGFEFEIERPVWADSLEVVNDDEIATRINSFFQNHNQETLRETDATKELKKIVKKKKED